LLVKAPGCWKSDSITIAGVAKIATSGKRTNHNSADQRNKKKDSIMIGYPA
jgi:hypothetical protein